MLNNARMTVVGLLVLALVVAFAACSSEPGDPQASQSAPPTESAGAAPAGSSGSGSARDVGSLDICALVPVADVAGVVGHAGARGSAEPNAGTYATDCTYTIESGGSSEYAMIWAYPLELWMPEARDDIEEVSGLGDAAFVTTSGSFTQVHVLVEGDIYIDVRAGTPEQARALAELALARFAGNP